MLFLYQKVIDPSVSPSQLNPELGPKHLLNKYEGFLLGCLFTLKNSFFLSFNYVYIDIHGQKAMDVL